MTAEFSSGQHIGDYEILSILGAGGMGKVYKVRNVISDRIEAMKILLPDLSSNQSLADRFLREIRLLAALNHPNIAALRTALTYENQLVMIMEYVEGETLSNRLARAPISTAEAVNFADQVLSALSYAHKENVIHRDIKPANMMLTPQGGVKLMDFGIARSTTDGALTNTGTTLGSLNYMPPEQVKGEPADARSDIYSFGVSLYELLTGKLPFQGDSQYSLMTAHLNQTPPAPISIREDLPPALNEIIMMAMAKNPAERFQSADAFRNALKSVPVSELPSSSTTAVPRAPKPVPAGTPTPKPASATTLVETPLLPRVPTVATPQATRGVTPPPAPPMPPTQVVPQPTAVAVKSGSRGLWLGIGALVGAGVLIAGGVYIPRHIGTHADQNKAVFPSSSATPPANSDQSAKPPDATSPSAAVANDGSVVLKGSDGSVSVDANGNVAIQSSKGNLQVGNDGAVKINGKGQGNSTTGKTPVPPRADAPQPWRESAQSAPQPPPGPSPEELQQLQDEADKLSIRAATASQSVDTLRQQQNAAGYNLRADIASSQERMHMLLSKGNAALKANDVANAKKYFDQAEAELTRLEKFLGH